MAKDKFDDNSMENKAVNSEDSLRVSEEVDQNSGKVENDFSQFVGLQNDDNLISASEKENGRVDDCVKPADTKSDISAKGKKRFKIRTADIAVTAVMTALVIVFTSFIKVPIGAGGYIHLGDLMILLSASILPLPFALLSSCVGAALSDVIVLKLYHNRSRIFLQRSDNLRKLGRLCKYAMEFGSSRGCSRRIYGDRRSFR